MLGKGASGLVSEGYWRSTPVAVKRYKIVKYALHEFSIMRLLHHPNIVQMMGICEDPVGDCILIMERLTGTTLDKVMSCDVQGRQRKLCHRLVNDITRQILMAFRYLHEHRPEPVAHRDLKPSNIFIQTMDNYRTVRVKLLDFGVSIMGDPDPSFNRRVGTPMFMAPEIHEDPEGIRTSDDLCRTDMYALAIVLKILWEQNTMDMHGMWWMTPPTIRCIIKSATQKIPSRRPCPSQILHVLDHRWKGRAHRFQERFVYNLRVMGCNFYETFKVRENSKSRDDPSWYPYSRYR